MRKNLVIIGIMIAMVSFTGCSSTDNAKAVETMKGMEGLELLTDTYMSFSSQIAVDRGAGEEVEQVDIEKELNEVYENEEGVTVDALGVNGEVTEDEYDEVEDNEDTATKEADTTKKETETKKEETATEDKDDFSKGEISQGTMDAILESLHEKVESRGGGHIEGNPPPEGATDSNPENDEDYQFGSSGPEGIEGARVQ